ncbi:MAG: DUF2946 family protein [Acidobacteriota bacterium]|nr:DUF2946 family protein [Acidobacteriota bacterium]
MDDSVLRAMARMPNVPAAYGWLSLDRRGRWFLRGNEIDLPLSIAFFKRNYDRDEQGRWYVQNGPQRVFVALDYLPLIWFLDATGNLRDHTDRKLTEPLAAYVDEFSNLILVDERGPGRVSAEALFPILDGLRDADGRVLDSDGLDALIAGEAEAFLHLCGKTLPVQPILEKNLPELFHFQKNPQPDAR